MKKFLSGLIVGLILATTTFAFAQTGQVKLKVNGKYIEFPEAPPQLINNRTMVPARPLAEALGARVDWDATNNTVEITDWRLIAPNDRPNNQPENSKWTEGFQVNGKRTKNHAMGFTAPDDFYMEVTVLNEVLADLGKPTVTADVYNDVWSNSWFFISLNKINLEYRYDNEKGDLVVGNKVNEVGDWITPIELQKYKVYVSIGDKISFKVEGKSSKDYNYQGLGAPPYTDGIYQLTPTFKIKVENGNVYFSISDLKALGIML